MKLYFRNEYDERCYPLSYHINCAREEGITEIELFEAAPLNEPEFFFCRSVGEVGETGECGKKCEDYSPCNGKSGKCRHKGKLYTSIESKVFKVKP